MGITEEDLKKTSYIRIDKFDDRVTPLQPCYLGNSEWEAWFPTAKGLSSFKLLNVMDMCYFSKAPAKETDVYIDFINFLVKKAYFKDIVHFERGIVEDINNLSTSVSKINFFHETWKNNNKLITRRFVTTEIEYIFKVCRSLFDLLQEVIAKIWSRFRYSDPNMKIKKLKPTFSAMVFKSNKLSSSKEISERYLIPKLLADFYVCNGVFFEWLRTYRDKISHGGNNIDSLYIMDDGFAISTEVDPFKGLYIWKSTDLKTNNLGSVRALVAYAILNTLKALNDAGAVIQSIMALPPDIAPEHQVFIRGENICVLYELDKYMNGNEWVKYNK